MALKRAALGCAALLTVALPLRAAEPEPAATAEAPKPEPPKPAAQGRPAPERLTSIEDRPYTVAELNAGVIVLPTAPISPSRRGGDVVAVGAIGKGDATLILGLQALFRGGRYWAVGAGARFGPSPTSDDQYGGASGLNRTHSRSYLWLGAEGRFIPLHFGRFEAWGGAVVGGIVVADRFVTNDGEKVPTVLGERPVTIATQGLSLGAQLGINWNFAERWTTGFALRTNAWFLPQSRACSPILDCATLTGTIFAMEMGLSIGYRIPL
jgi:hypothetical protein